MTQENDTKMLRDALEGALLQLEALDRLKEVWGERIAFFKTDKGSVTLHGWDKAIEDGRKVLALGKDVSTTSV